MISYVPRVSFYAILYFTSVPKFLLRKIHLEPQIMFQLVPLLRLDLDLFCLKLDFGADL